jgi:glutaminase
MVSLMSPYKFAALHDDTKYSLVDCVGCEKKAVSGSPDLDLASNSYVEIQNLAMRMNMRRFTRLTNPFSKKLENHMHAVAIHYMHYNLVRIRKSLRCTPAMEAGVAKTLWSIDDIVALLNHPR